MRRGHGAAVFLGCALLLGLIAWASPLPDRVTDRDVYEATAAHGIVVDCTDLHCFRVLVPWVLGSLPGGSLLKWKAYAVIANTAAAFAVWQLCLAFGLSRRVCWIAAAFSLLGFGALYTLHDVYTADPLMYVLGPVVTYQLLRERVAVAGLIAAAGVLAKEFVAAPLFMFSAAAFLERRYAFALRVLVAANTVFLVWLVLQLTLMLAFNYGYGDSASTQVMSGGVVGPWLARQSWRGALSAIFNEFGAVYGTRRRRLLERSGAPEASGDLRDSRGPDLRLRSAARSGLVEPPLPGDPAGRDCARTRPGPACLGHGGGLCDREPARRRPDHRRARREVCAGALSAPGDRQRDCGVQSACDLRHVVRAGRRMSAGMSKGIAVALVLQTIVLAALLTLALDIYAHKRVEQLGGVNIWGYRGPVVKQKQPNEIRIGVLGGSLAFGWGVPPGQTVDANVRQFVALAVDRPGRVNTRVTTINLGAMGLPAAGYADRLARYPDFGLDVVCVYPDAIGAPPRAPLPARDSGFETLTGYTPILPLVLEEKGAVVRWAPAGALLKTTGRTLRALDRTAFRLVSDAPPVGNHDPAAALESTVAQALIVSKGVVLVLPPPQPGRFDTGFEELDARIAARYASDGRVRVVDLSRDPRLQDRAMRLNDLSYGAGGNAAAAEPITAAVLDVLKAGHSSPMSQIFGPAFKTSRPAGGGAKQCCRQRGGAEPRRLLTRSEAEPRWIC